MCAAGAAAAQEADPARESPDAAPYEFATIYTADYWHNTRGGLRRGGTYLDNLDLTLSVDGESAWGARGLSAFVYVLYNNQSRFSERYTGDAMTVSNIDAARAVRLYEAWIEWHANAAQEASLRFGLYDLNSEFDTSDTRALFINSTHGVGHELGQTGVNGPSIFPVTSLALRLAWRPAAGWRLLGAIMDGVPGDRDHPERSGMHLSADEGVLAIGEAQWSRGRVRKLAVGHWRYSAEFSDVRETTRATVPKRRNNRGSYTELDIGLGASGADGEYQTSGFLRYGVANGRINEFGESFGVGLRRRGPFGKRPDDELGLAFGWARVSPQTRSAAIASGGARDSYEAAIELTYRATLNERLTIQPDVQFIFNPGADPQLSDSLALGLRLEVSMLQ
jgi:porin